MKKNCITDLNGIKVGQISDVENFTGCTVVLIPEGAICGVDTCGGAPGSRETNLLSSEKDNNQIHAIFISGGSSYGLSVADGIMKYLEENNIGVETAYAKIPIVPGAVIYDLNLGSPFVRPNGKMGYEACKAATDFKIKEGNIGAGTGATVGKILGYNHMMKGGVGSASFIGENGLIVAAIVVVNAVGDIRDYKTGKILAGPLINDKIQDTLALMTSMSDKAYQLNLSNTTIAIIGTNAELSKAQCNILAKSASHGLIRSIYPVCTTLDGDTVFAFSNGNIACDINIVSTLAAKVLSESIENAIKTAETVNGTKSYKSLQTR